MLWWLRSHTTLWRLANHKPRRFFGRRPECAEKDDGNRWKGFAAPPETKLYLDAVTVATPPEDYAQRLVPMFPGSWTHLRLHALEAHAVALSKLERNYDRDRDDVRELARAGHLIRQTLRDWYYKELRPNLLAHEDRCDLTLALWLDSWPS